MNYLKQSSKKTKKANDTGKKWFLYCALPLLALVAGFAWFFSPPSFQECAKGEFNPKCLCPQDEKYIGKRNIIFVDVTDQLPKGKVQDLYRLIRDTAFPEHGFWDWIAHGRKVEKTSIYLLSNQKPTEMIPIASYCSFPPAATWLLTDLSAQQEKEIKNSAINDIARAVDTVVAKQDAGRSHIVEALATITSNASYWTPGSKLILLSDLYENSLTCGYFENSVVPSFNSVSQDCKTWVNRLGNHLVGQSKQTHKNSTVAVCQILSKPQKEGLIAFWRELFQSELGYDIIFSCDSQEIADRQKMLNP